MIEFATIPEYCDQTNHCMFDAVVFGTNPHTDSEGKSVLCKIVGKCKMCGKKVCNYGEANASRTFSFGNVRRKGLHCQICAKSIVEVEKEFPSIKSGVIVWQNCDGYGNVYSKILNHHTLKMENKRCGSCPGCIACIEDAIIHS
ncbi:hypothetical protein LCGC14_0549600 [marine sediment metagenome]|uniref:Uncharacterized protein n=1 Tax=marine sediment metagenome TaxID=412755 RepID=A0A0F9UYH0_9ZZZZ